jgi:hypothetical protein
MFRAFGLDRDIVANGGYLHMLGSKSEHAELTTGVVGRDSKRNKQAKLRRSSSSSSTSVSSSGYDLCACFHCWTRWLAVVVRVRHWHWQGSLGCCTFDIIDAVVAAFGA